MSDLFTRLACPECGGRLDIWWSREQEQPFIKCELTPLHIYEVNELEHLFLKQFYKTNKYKV